MTDSELKVRADRLCQKLYDAGTIIDWTEITVTDYIFRELRAVRDRAAKKLSQEGK